MNPKVKNILIGVSILILFVIFKPLIFRKIVDITGVKAVEKEPTQIEKNEAILKSLQPIEDEKLKTIKLEHITIDCPEGSSFVEKQEEVSGKLFKQLYKKSVSYTMSIPDKDMYILCMDLEFLNNNITYDMEIGLRGSMDKIASNLGLTFASKGTSFYELFYKQSDGKVYRFLSKGVFEKHRLECVIVIAPQKEKSIQNRIIKSCRFNYN